MSISILPVRSVIDGIPELKVFATIDNEVAGEVSTQFYGEPIDGVVEVKEFEVFPRFRGRGIGVRLLRRLIREARRRRGISRLTVLVRHDNHVAKRVYRKAGFKIFRPDPDDLVSRHDRYSAMVIRLRGA